MGMGILMATKPPLVNLPDPKMMAQQLMQQRQQQWGSGNVAQMHQATVGNALDALFGNPLVKRAQQVQSRVAEAEKSVFIEEGDDDVTAEMKRLAAIRDAVSDLDPAVTEQVTERMLQLQQVRLERDKLKAQTVKEEALTGQALARTDKAVIDSRIALNDESREEELHPLEIDAKRAATDSSRAAAASARTNAAAKQRERTNWMKPDTGDMISVPNADAATAARLAAEGWVEAGNPQIQGTKDEVTGMTKPTMTDLEGSVVGARKQLDTFYQMAGQFKPEYLNLPKQWAMGAERGWSKLTGKQVPAKIVADSEQYYAFRRNVMGGLNEYIKYVTGAQAAVAEYSRIEKAFPNMSMDQGEFISSLREVTRQSLAIEKRSQQALAAGFKPTPEQIQACNSPGKACIWETMQMPAVSDEEVDRFLSPLGIPPAGQKAKPKIAAAKPAAPFKPFKAQNGAVVLEALED
jgi:hypothetical protein